eukprot:gene3937-4303_t
MVEVGLPEKALNVAHVRKLSLAANMRGEIFSAIINPAGVEHDLPVGLEQLDSLPLYEWERFLADLGYIGDDPILHSEYFVCPLKFNDESVTLEELADYNHAQNYLRARAEHAMAMVKNSGFFSGVYRGRSMRFLQGIMEAWCGTINVQLYYRPKYVLDNQQLEHLLPLLIAFRVRARANESQQQ